MCSQSPNKKAMCGVKCWCPPHSYPHHVNVAGKRHLRDIMNPSEHTYQMQASPARNLSPANVRMVVLGNSGAKRATIESIALCFCEGDCEIIFPWLKTLGLARVSSQLLWVLWNRTKLLRNCNLSNFQIMQIMQKEIHKDIVDRF